MIEWHFTMYIYLYKIKMSPEANLIPKYNSQHTHIYMNPKMNWDFESYNLKTVLRNLIDIDIKTN